MPRWAWDRNEESLIGILLWEAHLETRLEYVKRCQRTALHRCTEKRIRELQLEQQQRDLQRPPPQQNSSRPTSNAEPRWIFSNPAQLARLPKQERSVTTNTSRRAGGLTAASPHE
jgi:hypothetical protein